MAKQKVISININTAAVTTSGYNELQFPDLEKLLDEGYVVKDRFATTGSAGGNSGNYCINITFVLEKA